MKNGYWIYRCPRCRFGFVPGSPTDTRAVYNREYFAGAGHGFGYVNYEEDKIAMRPFFGAVLDAIESHLAEGDGQAPSPRRLLDVGAATGFFVKLAEARGWTAVGLEISPYAVARARATGADVRLGALGDTLPADPFDALTLLDVIEHVSDPGRMLAESRRMLRPGGVIAINTPDTASWWARAFGARWHAYCPPEHLSYFNSENLSTLLAEHSFRVRAISKLGKRFTPAYLCSMLYRWQGIGFWRRLGRAIEPTALNRAALPVNIRDNFFIIAERV